MAWLSTCTSTWTLEENLRPEGHQLTTILRSTRRRTSVIRHTGKVQFLPISGNFQDAATTWQPANDPLDWRLQQPMLVVANQAFPPRTAKGIFV